jgi:hypothetical protein
MASHFFFPWKRDSGVHPGGNAEDFENKRVAGKAIRKTMKTKGRQDWGTKHENRNTKIEMRGDIHQRGDAVLTQIGGGEVAASVEETRGGQDFGRPRLNLL